MEVQKSPPTSWTAESRRFIEAGGNTTHSFGLGRMIGRMFALLYLSPHPVSLEEIATRLEVSKASASIVVRQLFDFQAVRLVALPGDRRDFYEAEVDILCIVKRGVMPGLRKKLQTASTQIERTLDASTMTASSFPQGSSLNATQRAEIRRRLRQAQNWHRRIDRLLASKLLSKFL
jgi:DNA-binding transcriptional regulator GbsR (MarR family)